MPDGSRDNVDRNTDSPSDVFLQGISLRPIRINGSTPFRILGLALGKGASALEVLVAKHESRPDTASLRSFWKARKGGRAAPLLVAVLYGSEAAVCGPSGEDPPLYLDIEPGQLERICREALEQSDRHSALRSLRDSLPALASELGGVRNEGFLATHELLSGARLRDDWKSANDKSLGIMRRRGQDLLKGLGFQVDRHDNVTSVLRSADRKVAIALLLNRDESPEMRTERFSGLSPVSYALAAADRENLPYVLVLHGPKIRVYPTRAGIGVGRRGRSETYVECHTGLLRDTDAAYIWLLCSAEALMEGGSLDQIIEASGRFAGDLAERLRDRVYQSVVPRLAEGIVAARRLKKPTVQDLSDTYEMTMLLLFRLLFVAYAEDKDLLPYRWNDRYRRRSLKTKSKELLEMVCQEADFDTGDSLWSEITHIFQAIELGNKEWAIPAYDGGLFSSDPNVSLAGEKLAQISLPNSLFGPALRDLLLVESAEGIGPVDFRSLGVGEFGTIYEGLLESELSAAECDLTTEMRTEKGRKQEIYRPTKPEEEPLVRAGEVYLHNASGARKSSGSYFTKRFAVEHLLDRALEPALENHLRRLEDIKEDDKAADSFFDFRVADIAMGSAHFLIAAIDRIERALTDYLSQRQIPGVALEIASLRLAATESLGPLADQVEIEDAQLLRRLIARRCIYGVDINSTAVQLARLAVWVHTFVPGLPLSLLNHNLVRGNSLVGIANLREVEEKIEEVSLPLFPLDAEHLLGGAREYLRRLARITDATASDLERARKAQESALRTLAPTAALFDIVTAFRIRRETLPEKVAKSDDVTADIVNSDAHKTAQGELANLRPFHFPIAFPEVFLRERPGFDVMIGNPPWQEATIEEDAFWARQMPGLRGLRQREQEKAKSRLRKERTDLVAQYERELAEASALRRALVAGPFPGMGTGDPDLYKAFCWRFWELVQRDGGHIGVVLPRSALAAKGSAEFRLKVLARADEIDITTLLNNKRWFFEDVHPQYTIGLVAFEKRGTERAPVALRGPYSSLERYRGGIVREPTVVYGQEIREWNDTASLPLLPTEDSYEVFAQLRKAPRLDLNDGKTWRARPHTELHATNDKRYMDLKSKKCPKGFWPVYKGESFDIWEPDTRGYYAWADPKVILPVLQKKRARGGKTRLSSFSEFPPHWIRDPETLPCQSARIAFRDVTRSTDTRTIRAALIPPKVFITNKGPFFLWPRGRMADQAYLLGLLCSLPLDWYARRFVELGLNFYILNPFPIPRPGGKDPLRLRVMNLAGRLACADERFSRWAAAVGTECGPLDPEEKQEMIQELDAIVAHLYGLQDRHLVHIFETFHKGWDYEDRLLATLKHYHAWGKRL